MSKARDNNAEKIFSCQSTSLFKATEPIHPLDFRHYLCELTSEEFRGIELIKRLIELLKLKIRFLLGLEKHRIAGKRKRTPIEALNLKPSEIVEVKSFKEILETLDSKGRNRGLEFTPEMRKYCGKRFKVLKRVNQMIIEETGKMRQIPNTVILEGVTCDGKAHRGCQRTCFCLWREIWLKRVGESKE